MPPCEHEWVFGVHTDYNDGSAMNSYTCQLCGDIRNERVPRPKRRMESQGDAVMRAMLSGDITMKEAINLLPAGYLDPFRDPGRGRLKRERDEAKAEAEKLRADLSEARTRRDKWKAREGRRCERTAQIAKARNEAIAQRDALERAMRDIYKHAPMGGYAHHTARKALAALNKGNEDN